MNIGMEKPGMFLAAVMAAALVCPRANAQVPEDLPTFTVTTYDSNRVAPGYVFLAVAVPLANHAYYALMVDNQGKPFWYKKLRDEAYDFKMLPNGHLHYAEFLRPHSWTGGGDSIHEILDDNYNWKETIAPGNGYVAESHEFKMLPNGHVLLQAYYRSQFDMSGIVEGGYPNALISGTAIQELDAHRNVVWQWRTWDHFTLEQYLPSMNPATLKQAVINAFHLNTLEVDTDGNLLVSNYSVDVWKINRQTGAVMWRLGGPANEFSFADVDAAEAVRHFVCHDVKRLENGNLLLYTNGDRAGTRTSKVYEYRLDEVNKVARLVWQFTPATPIYAWHRGSVQRLANGNTFIGWGGVTGAQGAACTEVTPEGKVVFEMKFDDPTLESYRAYRFEYPPASRAMRVPVFEVATGNQYTFGNTGVGLNVQSGGGGYNTVTVSREPYAPVDPLFPGPAPRVLPVRVHLTENNVLELQAEVEFDSASFRINDPANTTVYYRPRAGQGLFLPQMTGFNPVTKKLLVNMSLASQAGELGEFIFGYPDVAPVAHAPILNAVENYRGLQPYGVIAPLKAGPGLKYPVNQEVPVFLSWSPLGFADWYQVQISTQPDFTNPVVNVGYQTNAFYLWEKMATATTYHYRVRAWNSAGSGPWVSGSFETVPPAIQVTAPSAEGVLVRGLPFFIQWQDNINEEVQIELYQGGAPVRTLSTNAPSNGAFKWNVAADMAPGSDYSIRISSATNSALFTTSQPFGVIDTPMLDSSQVTRLPDGKVQLTLSVPGATRVTVMVSTDLATWQTLQAVPLPHGSGVFTDSTAGSSDRRFYRLRVP